MYNHITDPVVDKWSLFQALLILHELEHREHIRDCEKCIKFHKFRIIKNMPESESNYPRLFMAIAEAVDTSDFADGEIRTMNLHCSMEQLIKTPRGSLKMPIIPPQPHDYGMDKHGNFYYYYSNDLKWHVL